jgi:1,4-dihydroxy-2-naphthoyl-CoA hydrolase
MSPRNPAITVEGLNQASTGHLPGLLGIEILSIDDQGLRAQLAVRRELYAPNGFLHAGSVVTLADTACGYACRAWLPEGANGFTI